MDTKKLLIFIAGAAVAYFVIKQMDKNKRPNLPMAQPPAGPNPKMVACQAELEEALKTVRVADLEGYKTQFMADCMAAPEVNGTTGNIPADIPMAPSGFDSGVSEEVLVEQANISLENQLGI